MAATKNLHFFTEETHRLGNSGRESTCHHHQAQPTSILKKWSSREYLTLPGAKTNWSKYTSRGAFGQALCDEIARKRDINGRKVHISVCYCSARQCEYVRKSWAVRSLNGRPEWGIAPKPFRPKREGDLHRHPRRPAGRYGRRFPVRHQTERRYGHRGERQYRA